MKPLLTTIEHVGQAYVDEAVMREVSKAKPLAMLVHAALLPKGVRALRPALSIQPLIEEIDHYEHTRLRWMKPDGKGGLVPR